MSSRCPIPLSSPPALSGHQPVLGLPARASARQHHARIRPLYDPLDDDGACATMTSNSGGQDQPGSHSPDGKRFVFARDDKSGDPIGLFVVNVDRSDLHRITPRGALLDGSSGDWSPRANQILFSRHATPDVHDSIWVVRADGSGLHEIHVQPTATCGGPNSDPNARGCSDPRWSPDGQEIVFARTTNTGTSLYTINADGTHLLRVTHGGSDEFPDWGPLD